MVTWAITPWLSLHTRHKHAYAARARAFEKCKNMCISRLELWNDAKFTLYSNMIYRCTKKLDFARVTTTRWSGFCFVVKQNAIWIFRMLRKSVKLVLEEFQMEILVGVFPAAFSDLRDRGVVVEIKTSCTLEQYIKETTFVWCKQADGITTVLFQVVVEMLCQSEDIYATFHVIGLAF